MTDDTPSSPMNDTPSVLHSLAEILQVAPVGLFVVDHQGTPVYANARAEEILGRGVDPTATPETLARSYSAYVEGTEELYPPERMPLVRALGGETSSADDMEIRTPNGTRQLEVTGAPLVDEEGRVKYAVAVFYDITGARKVERALRRLAEDLAATAEDRARQLRLMTEIAAQKLQGSVPEGEICARCWLSDELDRARESADLAERALKMFLANVSHEIRTPLNQIIGFSDLIQDRLENGVTHDLDTFWDYIRQGGRSLLETIDRLVTVAESGGPGCSLNLEILDVERFLRDLAGEFETAAAGNGNRLELALESDLGRAQTDSGRVRAALQQLIGNACKHCRNGIVSIRASRSDDGIDGTIEVVVRDTGEGIAPRRAERLIRGHADPNPSDQSGGLGIGIPLAARALDAVGGSLEFCDEPGPGSCFVARFPAFTRG